MSDPKRLHPITIAFSIIKRIKESIIPILLYFFLFALKEGKDELVIIEDGGKWVELIPYFILILILLIIVATSTIQWLRYTYRIEDMELRIEHGLFVKKKRYIPFDRIQSLDFSEGILHRPFGLVKVKVETAGGNSDEAEAEMNAVKKTEANALKRMIADAKSSGKVIENSETEIQEKETILYKITGKQLLFFASTSGSAGVIISAIIAFGAQFDELIPFKAIFKELEDLFKAGFLLLAVIICFALFLAWLISIVLAYLKYNDFTLKVVDDEFIITRGLLEKRTTTIPIRRVQAVTIKESLFRQPFGYASVSVEYAGGSILDENTEGLLMPVVKKEKIGPMLQETLSDYAFDIELKGAPKRARRRYIIFKVLITIILTAILSIWLWPFGLLASLLIGGAWILGILQYKSAGWNLTDHQLTLRYRNIDQLTIFMKKNRIQTVHLSESWFQKRANLAAIQTAIMSNGVSTAGISHMNIADAREIYEWYRPSRIKVDS